MMTPTEHSVQADPVDDLLGTQAAYHADLRLRTLDDLLATLQDAYDRYGDAIDAAYHAIHRMRDERGWVMRMHNSVTELRRHHMQASEEAAAQPLHSEAF